MSGDHSKDGHAGSEAPVGKAIATGICLVFGLAGFFLSRSGIPQAATLSIAACIVAYLAGGSGPTISAFASLKNRQPTVDLLMILAALGAAAIGEWMEGVVLLFLFSLSGTLEEFAMYRTTRSLSSR